MAAEVESVMDTDPDGEVPSICLRYVAALCRSACVIINEVFLLGQYRSIQKLSAQSNSIRTPMELPIGIKSRNT